jgi:hypothetical protein
MIGLAVLTGVAAFVGVRMALRRRGGGCHGGFRGWGHHHRHLHQGWDEPSYDEHGPEEGFGGHPFRGGGWGRGGFVMRSVMSRIGARPDQEEVIRDAVNELKDTASKAKGEGKRTRQDLADILRRPNFDEVMMGELFARHDTVMDTLRKSLVGAMGRTHNVLDDRQRARLADLIAQGPWAFRDRGW